MAIYKKISSHGSVSIPVALRRELGLEPKDPVEVTVTKDNWIEIKPYLLRCAFCKTQDGVESFHGKGICGKCAKEIREKLTRDRRGTDGC